MSIPINFPPSTASSAYVQEMKQQGTAGSTPLIPTEKQFDPFQNKDQTSGSSVDPLTRKTKIGSVKYVGK